MKTTDAVGKILLLMITLFVCALPDTAHAAVNRTCQGCHDDQKFQADFNASVHGSNGCRSCHKDIKDLDRHMTGQDRPAPVSCGTCHQEIAQRYRRNFHYLQEDFRCVDCHRDIHNRQRAGAEIKRRTIEKCTACHSNTEYVASGHSEAVLKGNRDGADCGDCHGLHDTRVYHTSLEKYPVEARTFYTQKCNHCHADKAMMRRNGISENAVELYEETYHGKVRGVGQATLVAGCADCHRTHNILPKTDPRSSIHPSNLVENCGRCHHGFHPRFVEYKAHPDFRDKKRYPALYWTFVFMSGLLIFTFSFFWLHTALWWRKSYWENHAREKGGLIPPVCERTLEGYQHIQRFTAKERIMHLLLLLSFFTLVTTGFPLKYHATVWAKAFIGLWGGAESAGLWHRIAAGVLMLIVAYVIVLSCRFLFCGGEGKGGWKERLFGPDSLFPRKKDWEDMKGMFRWFFNKGPKPRFDRWTYWEKFDFWAVFWGMFAIGGSGLLLWKPEWSSYIVPGWVLNVATIVHSEEALLAALFIFTVHFFNTHFVPDKFPMDRLIFTGTHTIDELQRDRPLEYERLMEEERLDSLKREHPSIPLKLISAVIGLGSLLLGLTLTALIYLVILFG